MNYALIENNIITNIIWLHPGNVNDFPNAVSLNDVPASIGDTYIDGVFYRNGERILSMMEQYQKELYEQSQTIAELDIALLDATYEHLV